MIGRATCVITLVFVTCACAPEASPRDQWKISVSTDAPVPMLGDRLLVELFDEQGKSCSNCRHHFDASSPSSFPLSFGVEATTDPLRVRARLYRAELVGHDGLPEAGHTIDAIARLPAARGVEDVLLELRANCFGIDAEEPNHLTCDPTTRTLGAEPMLAERADQVAAEPGTWPPAVRIDCPDVPAGMACLPGGVFLLGVPRAPTPAPFLEGPERVVQLPPFALDLAEVSVADIRARVGVDLPPPPGSVAMNAKCTFIDADTPDNDELPITCVDRSYAAAYCALLERRLPTEAEWEYAATNAGLNTTYPWGDDPNVCAHAHVARGNVEDVGNGEASGKCHDQTSAGKYGPTGVGGAADVTSASIRNLGGNVAELVEGLVAPYDDPCWNPEQFPLLSPHCGFVSGEVVEAVRGGDWTSVRDAARSAGRGGVNPGNVLATGGFRCARSM